MAATVGVGLRALDAEPLAQTGIACSFSGVLHSRPYFGLCLRITGDLFFLLTVESPVIR